MNISNDYRNTDKCPKLSNVSFGKRNLEERIRLKHKKAVIMFNFVSDKSTEYYEDFKKIYNYKCAYCGVDVRFIGSRLMEVDHFINESSFEDSTDGRAEAGKVSNLVFSCYPCNRGKGKFHIKSNYRNVLNPDDNSIAAIFNRDDMYNIYVDNNYANDEFVQQLFARLSLSTEARRIDYLLIEMQNLVLQLQCSNKEVANNLEICMNKLQQKRNLCR